MSAAPTPYDRQYDFETFQQNNPTTPLPAQEVDIELDAVKTAMDTTQARLAQVQRDDGALYNGIVTTDSLNQSVINLFTTIGAVVRGAWVTATVYALKDIITQSGVTYMAAVAHTSGTFATDLAAGKWVLLASQAVFNQTRVFADAAALAAGVPLFAGQLAIRLDTNNLYVATGILAGNWVIQPIAVSQIANLSIPDTKLAASLDLSTHTVVLPAASVTYGMIAPNTVDFLPGVKGFSMNDATTTSVSIAFNLACLLLNNFAVRFGPTTLSVNFTNPVGPGGLDVGTKANSTWYHVFLISNGTLVKAIFSLSSSVPSFTNAAGYSFYMFVGTVRVASTGSILSFFQYGSLCVLSTANKPLNAITGVTLSTQLALTTNAGAGDDGIPPTAISFSGMFGRTVATAAVWNMEVTGNFGPNIVGGGTSSSAALGGFSGCQTFNDVPCNSVAVLNYQMGATTATAFSCYITGWRYPAM